VTVSKRWQFHVMAPSTFYKTTFLHAQTNLWNSLRTCLSLDPPLLSNVLRGLIHITPFQLSAPQAMCLHMFLAIVFAQERKHLAASFRSLAGGNRAIVLFCIRVAFVDMPIEMPLVCKPCTACGALVWASMALAMMTGQVSLCLSLEVGNVTCL